MKQNKIATISTSEDVLRKIIGEETQKIVEKETRKIVADETRKIVADETRKIVASETRKIVASETRKIVKDELKNFVTKAELAFELEKLERRIDENAQKYRDQILTKMDAITAENEQLKEDTDFNKYDIRGLKELTENHEKRITKLEQPQ